ncbi:MAG: proteasome subunit beta, partial [Candidatus Bathyarchaeia archaeon]
MENQAQREYLWVPGATTVGVVCSDGVILASEKRVSYGYLVVSKGGKKVFKIT